MADKDKELRDRQMSFFLRLQVPNLIEQPAVVLKPYSTTGIELTPEEQKEVGKVMGQFREEDRVTDSWWLDFEGSIRCGF